MLSFESDYTEGAHPRILQALIDTNFEQLPGYGTDLYCERAKDKIRHACGTPDAEIFFLAGGTQTNQIVIDAVLASYEGVISARTGHIIVHEAGAVEFTGHKVLELPSYQGKLRPEDVEAYLERFFQDANHEHMVFPGMVYISHPTEDGTLYTKAELEKLHAVCRRFQIPLFIDGARLGYGLMSLQSDLSLPEFASLCDVFYIGGTKVGALCGEAVVFSGIEAPKHFMTTVKQHGALLAKGRTLGVQFDALFTDDLYFTIAKNAIERAEELKALFREKEYTFAWESPTNQQFLVLPDEVLEKISADVATSFWEKKDASHTVVRFATSWATTKEQIEKLKTTLP